MTFEEIKSKVVKQLNATLNKDSTKEQIDVVKGIEKDIEEMGNIHTKLNSDYESVKNDYIGLIKESGNRKDTGNTGGGDTPQVDVDDVDSLEEDMGKFLKETRDENKDNK